MATWRVSEPADATEVPVGAGYIRENNTQIQAVLTASRLLNGTEIVVPFDSGGVVKQWFYLDTAPTGWTEIGSLGDTLLAVKGGATYTTGGATAGTWTQPDHTLVEAEMPSHDHTSDVVTDVDGGGSGRVCAATVAVGVGTWTSSSTGGDTAHNHGTSYRPAARVGIICSLD